MRQFAAINSAYSNPRKRRVPVKDLRDYRYLVIDQRDHAFISDVKTFKSGL